MIYLSKRDLLFLKPRKVAGTSIEIALSANADTGDIVTPMTARGFAIERQRCELGGHFPVNWAWRKGFEQSYRSRYDHYIATGETLRRFGRIGDKTFSKLLDCRYFNHISPRQLAWRAPFHFLERARIVTVVRNPYEFVVSLASHLRLESGGSLSDTVDRVLLQGPLNSEFYFSRYKPYFVIRLERLLDDLSTLETDFSIPIVKFVTVANSDHRTDRRAAKEILSARQIKQVQKVYERVFKEFDYPL